MNRIDQLKKLGEDICNKALAENRNLSKTEAAECQRIIQAIKAARDDEKLMEQIDRMTGFSQEGSGSIAAKARQTDGFLQGAPLVVPAKAVIGDVGDAAPVRLGGIEGMGLDRRYVYPNIPQRELGGGTRVEALIQSERQLASASEMRLALGGSGQKPESVVGVELADYAPVMLATLSELLPNVIVTKPAFAELIDSELRSAYREALDALVVETLYEQAGIVDDSGTDLFSQLRGAKTGLEAEGFSPDLAVVSPEDAQELDLSRAGADESGEFLLAPAPRNVASTPLWGMRVIAAKNVETPLVLDSRRAATLHLGSVSLTANPFEGFSSNQTRFRLEGPALLVVRQPMAIQNVASE